MDEWNSPPATYLRGHLDGVYSNSIYNYDRGRKDTR